MSSFINTNMVSLNTQNNLSKSQDALAISIKRLSTGLRINSAKDDAAGLAISNRMDSIVRGQTVAIRNTNDAVSFSQTADGALSQINNNLQRLRELAVQASNGTNSAGDRELLNTEFNQLQQEITRIQNNTAFNGTNALQDKSVTVQIGAGTTQYDKIAISGIDLSQVTATTKTDTATSNIYTRAQFDATKAQIAKTDPNKANNLYFNEINGHVYELVTSTKTYADAQTNAQNSTFGGQKGYLVTITSADENAFVYNKTGGNWVWINGSKDANITNGQANSSVNLYSASSFKYTGSTTPETGSLTYSNFNSGSNEPNGGGSSAPSGGGSTGGMSNDQPGPPLVLSAPATASSVTNGGISDTANMMWGRGTWNDLNKNAGLMSIVEYGGSPTTKNASQIATPTPNGSSLATDQSTAPAGFHSFTLNAFGSFPDGAVQADGITAVGTSSSNTPTLTTLANFNGANGRSPTGTLIADAAGNLYGTTNGGGTYDASVNSFSNGTVFEIDERTHTITTLVNFTGDNGQSPWAGLIADGAGNLYGTTTGNMGGGTVFKLAAGTHTLTTLVNFTGANGYQPYGGLMVDAAGNLYGTTTLGGTSGKGTVFEIAAGTNAFSTLASFDGVNGSIPCAGLIADAAGNFYGTTEAGGLFDSGTVFEIAAGTHTITTLVNLTGSPGPIAGLVADAAGNLYGATRGGGASNYGSIFEIAAGTHTFTTLASFNGANGSQPSGTLIADVAGNLYGTTTSNGTIGNGTVFELPAGTHVLRTLVNFTYTNGNYPLGGLMADASGNLYGTTNGGGSSDYGTVFVVSGLNTQTTSTYYLKDVESGSAPTPTGNTFGVNILTQADALSAINSIDTALQQVNVAQIQQGAIQNRLQVVINTLTASNESTTNARSHILDTDFASETALMARSQILQQAGMAMLAQANTSNNGILALLR